MSYVCPKVSLALMHLACMCVREDQLGITSIKFDYFGKNTRTNVWEDDACMDQRNELVSEHVRYLFLYKERERESRLWLI